MNATEKMVERVAQIIERNQRAMMSAEAKGDREVAEMCAEYHLSRLVPLREYLEERMGR